MDQPTPADPAWPRYSDLPFPPYRHVPGRTPHPRRDPKGHAYGTEEPKPPPLDPERWSSSPLYLHGVDLYNFAYWWECHEAFEALWHASGHGTPVGRLLQGVIQVAASHLKRFAGDEATAAKLARQGLEKHRGLPSPFLGMDVARFGAESEEQIAGRRAGPALIRLSVRT